MDLTDIFGYFGALLVGLVLGLMGGCCSILTVPIFVYLFALNPITATAYSLFVVGSTSLVGTLRNIKKKTIVLKPALVFAAPALVAVFLTRKFLIPALPNSLFSFGNFEVTKSIFIMLLFSIVMVLASVSMIRNKNPEQEWNSKNNINYIALMLQGLIIGLVTGLVGAGGGFLIVPALVLLAKMPMKNAVATSLVIIAINSLIGFLGDATNYNIDWFFLLTFTAISIVGILIGIWLNKFISGKKLKNGFGWFVLVMGLYIIYKELSL